MKRFLPIIEYFPVLNTANEAEVLVANGETILVYSIFVSAVQPAIGSLDTTLTVKTADAAEDTLFVFNCSETFGISTPPFIADRGLKIVKSSGQDDVYVTIIRSQSGA